MAKYRNTTKRALEVRLPEWQGKAEPDEVVDVPDEIAKKYDWPETIWSPVETEKHTRKRTTEESE